MVFKSFMVKPLAAAALLAIAGAAQAGITVYTSQAAFLAATSATGVDTFAGLSITGSTPSPLFRSAGPYAYTATVSTTSFFGAGTTANPWLSTNTATDSMTFSAFTGGVQAFGGNFFGSSIAGAFLAGDVVLTATDSSGSVSQTIVGATTGSFLGFVSTGLISSVSLCAVQPSLGSCGSTEFPPFLWPTVDNLTLGLAAAVPEAQTYAMMLAGLGLVGFMARRRRA